MNIAELLGHQARKYPQKEVLIDGAFRITYQELNEKANALAQHLIRNGLRQGDKIIIFMPNTKEFAYSYFAIQKIGAIVVPLNPKISPGELDALILHSEARAFLCHAQLVDTVAPLLTKHSLHWLKTGESLPNWESIDEVLAMERSDELVSRAEADDESTILYTSGTTGKPKGVLLTHRNILSVATMMCIETEMNVESRILHLMPLSHSAPLHLFFVAGFFVGATHVLAPTFSPENLLQWTEQERVTHFFGAPVAYLLTAKHPQVESYDLSSMKYWVYGGAPLSAPEVALIEEKLPNGQLMCVYGLTEAGPNGTLLTPAEHKEKAGSIGRRAALHCELKIVNEEGDEVGSDEVGEILLRGETVKAFIVLNQKMDEIQLAEECKRLLDGKLAKFKIPRLYEQCEELPRNASGKILKHYLRERSL